MSHSMMKTFPRFASVREFQWENDMLMYYTRKVRITMTLDSVLEMFEYIMTIPDYMATYPQMRKIVRLKLEELHVPNDAVWDNMYRSMLRFLDTLRNRPSYRA